MGYTHYWKRPRNNYGTAEMFGRLALDAKKIIAQAELDGIRIRDGFGEGEPNFNEAFFAINGDGTDSDLSHETFLWEGVPTVDEWRKDEPETFDFCKTAYKPYDAVVTAILIRAKKIYGNCITVSSDGNWSRREQDDYGNWSKGRDLYERVFGEEADNPFDMVCL